MTDENDQKFCPVEIDYDVGGAILTRQRLCSTERQALFAENERLRAEETALRVMLDASTSNYLTEITAANAEINSLRMKNALLAEATHEVQRLQQVLERCDMRERKHSELRAEGRKEALAVLDMLKVAGSCWCEVAIGNPMMLGHSRACIAAQVLMRSES